MLEGAGSSRVTRAVRQQRAKGVTSLRGIAAEFNGREIPTAQDGMWPVVQVQRGARWGLTAFTGTADPSRPVSR